MDERCRRWYSCCLCERDYHGVVAHALGWACWKTYLDRWEGGVARCFAMSTLSSGLYAVERHGERLGILEALLATDMRLGAPEENIIATKDNLGICYARLGRDEDALALRCELYTRSVALNHSSFERCGLALNLCNSLVDTNRCSEGTRFLRKILPEARCGLGLDHGLYLKLRWTLAICLFKDDGAPQDNLVEAVTILEELSTTARQVYSNCHPYTTRIQGHLEAARSTLAAFGA